MATRKDPGGGKKPPRKPVTSVAKLKANPSKDYMKPVGGTKQEGYIKPGGSLFDIKADRKKVGFPVRSERTRRTGRGANEPKSGFFGPVSSRMKTGINPTAMKATSGNPKPTTAQLTAGKKASDAAKARAAAKAKAKAAADKAAKAKDAKTAKKPTTGVYKRGNP